MGGGGVASLLAFLYFFYHYGWTGQRKFASSMGVVLYYLVPLGVAGLLFASLKLKAGYKIKLALLSVSLAASVFAVELFLQLSNASAPKLAVWQVQGQSREIKQRTREFARQYGVDFDTRDGIEILGELRRGGVDAVPIVSKWLDKNNDLWNWQPDGSIQSAVNIAGAEVIPLGAVANRLTVLCNESGQWITYSSDERGFNNPKEIWQSNPLDIAALGDSFAQGYCVPSDKSFVALIRQRFAATLNLPRWTPENRPVVDGAKPASGRAAPSTSVLPQSIMIEQAPRLASAGPTRGYRDIAPTRIGPFLRHRRRSAGIGSATG